MSMRTLIPYIPWDTTTCASWGHTHSTSHRLCLCFLSGSLRQRVQGDIFSGSKPSSLFCLCSEVRVSPLTREPPAFTGPEWAIEQLMYQLIKFILSSNERLRTCQEQGHVLSSQDSAVNKPETNQRHLPITLSLWVCSSAETHIKIIAYDRSLRWCGYKS